MSQKVLITGADGFIGSHLTESLLEAGYEVKAFVYYNSFKSWGWLGSLHPSRDFTKTRALPKAFTEKGLYTLLPIAHYPFPISDLS